jgi:hypothetical protein
MHTLDPIDVDTLHVLASGLGTSGRAPWYLPIYYLASDRADGRDITWLTISVTRMALENSPVTMSSASTCSKQGRSSGGQPRSRPRRSAMPAGTCSCRIS